MALAQLGVRPALVAVAGDDDVAAALLEQAGHDGIDVSAVARRTGMPSALIVEVLETPNRWRYLEHVPDALLLTVGDILAAGRVFSGAGAVLVQLQQPPDAVLAAARRGAAEAALVVLDGAPPDGGRRAELLAVADVIRAAANEAEMLTGVPAGDLDRMRAAAVALLDAGPSVVALGLENGNLFVWRDGASAVDSLVLPLADVDVVDTTGGGDAFVAALTVALTRGEPVPTAARRAVAASGATVGHPGGRPNLRTTA